MKSKITSLITGVSILTTAPLSAATLISWDFSGVPANVAPDNQPIINPLLGADKSGALPGVTSSELTGSAGLALSTGNPGAGELNLKFFDTLPIGSNDSYITFFLASTAPGTGISISSLSISLWRNGAAAPNNIAFVHSVDGGVFLPYGETQSVPATGAASEATYTFTQTVTGASSVEFRLVPFATAPNTAGTGNLHIDALRVEGTVSPVPEPSVLLLGLSGSLALLLRRRAL